ncbi:MAG: flagellar basal body L-ring protein FlgH [Rhizomicrobium sp.]
MTAAPRRLAIALLCLLPATAAHATDLYPHGNWPALASDRNAHQVGDVLEIVISESATASNTATNGSSRSTNLAGQVTAGASFNEGGALNLSSGSDNSGTTGRSGGIVALVSARVEGVLPNGDLSVAGAQMININGERTNIKIRGVVRVADIAPDNSVASSRLADAQIDYDGSGFVSRSAAPGLATRIFNWLGL